MKKFVKHIILLLITAVLTLGCGKSNYLNETKNTSFPSPGAPSGTDAISSSTNRSSKEGDIGAKLDPLMGADFIAPPQVNNYGSVSMSYPMAVPSGRAGMQPSAGLSYSSSGGDGLVGIGWNLGTGLGVISRTTRHGQLYYDHRDTFTFNGKRLVKVEGTEDSENGIYRMEIESGFSKFELIDAESGGRWYVYDKAGTITTFGYDSNSRIYQPEDENKIYIWNFTRSVDLNGNFMYAVYDTSEYDEKHILYLKEIRYTGNEDADIDANQYVRFHYKDRDDVYVSKAPGFIMTMDKLLDYVEIGWDDPAGFFGNNTELWRYTMIYEDSTVSKRPLLKTVDSTRNSTKPEFIYSKANTHFKWSVSNNLDYNNYDFKDAYKKSPDSIKYFEGDFNGDGISDMVFFNYLTGEWKAKESFLGKGFKSKTYASSSFINKFRGLSDLKDIQWFKGNVTGDYNGDGKSDIAFYLPGRKEFWVAEHNGRQFNFKLYEGRPLESIDIFKCEWFTGDFDGNGLSDAVLFNEPTGEWVLMRNMGGRF